MLDFLSAVKNVLAEQNKEVEDLFKDNVVAENTFYKYKHRYPRLKTLIKIANYLKVSIDYLFEYDDKNNFKKYHENDICFCDNLIALIEATGISSRKFCKDLNLSKDNVSRWKKGTIPSLSILFEIAKYFDCSVDDLLLKG